MNRHCPCDQWSIGLGSLLSEESLRIISMCFLLFFFLDMGLHTLPVTFDINLPLLCVLFLVNT